MHQLPAAWRLLAAMRTLRVPAISGTGHCTCKMSSCDGASLRGGPTNAGAIRTGVLKDLADRHFAHAKTIVLVQDNLNIHSKAPAAGMLWIDHCATPAARAAAGMVTSPRHIFAPAS